MLKVGCAYVSYISHEKLIEDNKADYDLALRKSQLTLHTNHENITAWLKFLLSISLEQAKHAIELLSHKKIERLLSPKQLDVWNYLLFVVEASPGEVSMAT